MDNKFDNELKLKLDIRYKIEYKLLISSSNLVKSLKFSYVTLNSNS